MQHEQTDNTATGKSFVRPFYAWSAIAVVLILGIGVLIPTSSDCRLCRRNQEPHHRSTTQVRSLAQGLILYAGKNNDMFPLQDEWAVVLVELGMIEPEFLVSPAEDGDGVSYIFVPGPFSFDSTQILIYEDPKHFDDGVLVGFVDSHVEMIDHETFERMLVDQLGAQNDSP